GLFHIVGSGFNDIADKGLFADRGACGEVLAQIPGLGCVLPVVAQHDQQWNTVFLGESQRSRYRVVMPRSVADDADDHLLWARELDAECGAQTGTQSPRPPAILLERLACV